VKRGDRVVSTGAPMTLPSPFLTPDIPIGTEMSVVVCGTHSILCLTEEGSHVPFLFENVKVKK